VSAKLRWLPARTEASEEKQMGDRAVALSQLRHFFFTNLYLTERDNSKVSSYLAAADSVGP